MFYGQHNEDVYLRTLFPDNTGVCVDVGAYNGISASNTFYFEKLGWRCLCIEPIIEEYEKCCSRRKECVNCCASDADKEDQQFTIYNLVDDNRSAISSLVPDQRLVESHQSWILGTETRNVAVRSLTSLLDEYKFPTNIDFISIDTENTELDVLKGLDLSKYNVKLFVIENNFDEPFCADYLKPFGYKKIHRIAVNDFFIKF